MKEGKKTHLEFVQNTIIRMNTNSFFIKGWSITMIAIILGLSKIKGTYLIDFKCYNIPVETISLLVIVLLFWYQNAFFLQQGRRFRVIYDCLIGKYELLGNEKPVKFDMNYSNYKKLYNIPENDLGDSKTNHTEIKQCFFGKTIWVIYMTLIAVILLLNHTTFNA